MKTSTCSLVSKSHGFLSVAIVTSLLMTLPWKQAYANESAKRQIFTYAVELYKSGKFSGAYGRFRSLASSGDADAARIALFMLRNGELLYGSAWSATQSEITQWLGLSSDRSGLTEAEALE